MIKFTSIENLQDFVNMTNTIEKICQKWVKQNLDNSWQHYCGFDIKDEYIIIKYSYNDIVNNIEYETCYGAKLVSWEKLIEFAKSLEL